MQLLSPQSCDPYLSSLGIEPRTFRPAKQCFCPQYFFFLKIWPWIQDSSQEYREVGLDYTLRTAPLWTYIYVRIFYFILRGCHIIHAGFRVVGWSSDPLYLLTTGIIHWLKLLPKQWKEVGFFCLFVFLWWATRESIPEYCGSSQTAQFVQAANQKIVQSHGQEV